GLVGLVPYIPIMFSAFIIENPNHLLVRIAGFVPPFAPSVMLLRVGVGAAPAWEIGLSLASLALGVFLTMRFAARVFEIGLLMYGKSPSLRELWRWGRAGRAR
ncbi:MAG: ABC transporter permease, partial [Candidatus Bipolaricaulis sp.]|nr:ABC transporter permease [Candidatus Bipolaricaulis sp.]